MFQLELHVHYCWSSVLLINENEIISTCWSSEPWKDKLEGNILFCDTIFIDAWIFAAIVEKWKIWNCSQNLITSKTFLLLLIICNIWYSFRAIQNNVIANVSDRKLTYTCSCKSKLGDHRPSDLAPLKGSVAVAPSQRRTTNYSRDLAEVPEPPLTDSGRKRSVDEMFTFEWHAKRRQSSWDIKKLIITLIL